ncbi:phosphotransferase [Microbacterium sp. GXS0129]|uniref:phosphotransferase n=1 Tax=Microbacterium sp. GXS0129 TaxID=3377836 RepID=UPI00383A9F94
MAELEIPLAGGNATAEVVRVGDTVRKPVTPSSAAVTDFMSAMLAAGIDIPRPLGTDESGRLMLEFVPGAMAEDHEPDLDQLEAIGGLIRRIHDAALTYVPEPGAVWEAVIPPPGEPELICHNDLTPWNLVLGERMVFIDWDGAGPSTRAWDLAYSAQAFAGLHADADEAIGARRLSAIIDGYDPDDGLRRELPALLAVRAQAMHDMLADAYRHDRMPWARVYEEGHGAFWAAAAEWIRQREDIWRDALCR